MTKELCSVSELTCGIALHCILSLQMDLVYLMVTAKEEDMISFSCVPLPASVSRPRERALSPSVLPGVRAIPSATGNAFRAQLVPGVYYAK